MADIKTKNTAHTLEDIDKVVNLACEPKSGATSGDLTDEQKASMREKLGAASKSDVNVATNAVQSMGSMTKSTFYTSSGKWVAANNNYNGIIIPVSSGDVVSLTPNVVSRLSFIKSIDNIKLNGAVDFSAEEGYSSMMTISIPTTYIVPTDTRYIFIFMTLNGEDRTPYITINGIDISGSMTYNLHKVVKSVDDMNSTIFNDFPNRTSTLMYTDSLNKSEIDKMSNADLSTTDGTYLGLVQQSDDEPSANKWTSIGSYASSINNAFKQVTKKYFRVLIKRADGGNITPSDVYIADVSYPIKERLEKLESSAWNGKSWYAFGTSISDTRDNWGQSFATKSGRYPEFLVKLSGLVHTNYAVRGSMLMYGEDDANRNSILKQIWRAAGYSETAVAGQMESEYAKTYNEANNVLKNADLITIEGFVNDFVHIVSGKSPQIGSIADMCDANATSHTLYGAIYLAIKYCVEANPNAKVILLTDHTGIQSNTQFDHKNANGDLQIDYRKATVDAAHFMGCECIDVGSKCNIDKLHPQYFVDNLHHNALGGEQFANTIWSELKNMQPNAK